MTEYLPPRYSSKKAFIFFMLMLSTLAVYAQKKAAAKMPASPQAKTTKAKPVADTYKVSIATSGVNAKPDNIPAMAQGRVSKLYSTIYIPLNVSGKTAKAVPIPLTINNTFTDASPVFENGTLNTTISIPADQFDSKDKTIFMPVVVSLKKYPDTNGGNAYIEIDKQKTGYLRVFFCDCATTAPDANKPADEGAAKGKTPTPTLTVTSAAASKTAISLLDSVTTFTLDTVLNKFKPQTVNIYFKLRKGAGKDTTITVIAQPDTPSPDMQIKEAGADIEVKIAKQDCDETRDMNIIRPIDLHIQQTALIKKQQKLLIHVKGTDAGVDTVKILPYKAKEKEDQLKLISSGNAEILSHGTSTILREIPSTVNLIDTVMVRVKLHGAYDPKHNHLVFAFLDTTLSKHFQILENPIEITAEEWMASKKDSIVINHETNEVTVVKSKKDSSIDIPVHIRSVNVSDSLYNVPRMDLVIKGQNQAHRGSKKIKLNASDKAFWAEIGTNFDLLDNIQTNNFYAGVYMYDKDVARLWAKKGGNNISFTGGVYESQSVSSRSTNNVFDYKDGASEILDTTNHQTTGYKTYRDTGVITATSKFKRIGLFFSPQFRLTTGKTNENGVHVFLAPYLEMLWQRVSSTIDYSKAKQTYTITPDTASQPNSRFASLPYKTSSFDFDFRSHYFGLGVPLYIKENDFNLYLNSTAGITSQEFAIISDNVSTSNRFKDINSTTIGYSNLLHLMRPDHGWNWFYLVQFRLNEVAYGITFSGEVRGLMRSGVNPVITLAISKKFDLSALLKPLVAPFK